MKSFITIEDKYQYAFNSIISGVLHNLYGPAFINGYNHQHNSYYVDNKYYNNFISYIKAVIEFRKLNLSKDKI